MKTRATAFALAVILATFFSTNVFAQANFTFRADVPFDFSINGHQYPAGHYDLVARNLNGVVLHNYKTGQAAIIPLTGRTDGKVSQGQLVFAVGGPAAMLIWLNDGDGHTWRVPVAAKEKRWAASKDASVATVALK